MRADIEVLTRTREKLASGWCRHRHAQNKNGEAVPVGSQEAVAWCVSGALMEVGGQVFGSAHNLIYDCLPRDSSVTDWNDQPGRTQTEVLELLDRAITKAREAK